MMQTSSKCVAYIQQWIRLCWRVTAGRILICGTISISMIVKKIRFTPAPEAQREIFIRLMELNQKIAAEEAASGLTPEFDQEEEEQVE